MRKALEQLTFRHIGRKKRLYKIQGYEIFFKSGHFD